MKNSILVAFFKMGLFFLYVRFVWIFFQKNVRIVRIVWIFPQKIYGLYGFVLKMYGLFKKVLATLKL